MKTLCKLVVSALSALLPASIALGQQEYIGHYDVYTAYMYLKSPLINLGESGFQTQIGTNPTKWYSLGFDFSAGTGDTVLQTNMLKTSLRQQIDAQLAPMKAGGLLPANYEPTVPMHSRSQTYALGPQLNYRHFRYVTLFAHPDLGAIHETAIPHANDAISRGLVANLAPSGTKEDWVYFYGVGGGADFNITHHVSLRVHVDFVRDHLFSDLLNSRNSVRFSIGPTFHMGKNMAAAK
jgi:opacity protein-like surface antigen